MKERINILSIDWDYFIKASMEERCRLFPDGGNENIAEAIGNMVWSGHYISDKISDELSTIGVDIDALNLVKRTLKKDIVGLDGFMIMDSHKHIYDFIMNNCDGPINLVNVDFHHDVYSNGEDVDCGNWMEKIIREFDAYSNKFTWVAREDSDTNIDDEIFNGCKNKLDITTDINMVTEYDWDLVFICRSSMWSPPHLDKEFIDAFEWILDEKSVSYQSNIFDNRLDDVMGMAEWMRNMITNSSKYSYKMD